MTKGWFMHSEMKEITRKTPTPLMQKRVSKTKKSKYSSKFGAEEGRYKLHERGRD
jgi:hypothetical protein